MLNNTRPKLDPLVLEKNLSMHLDFGEYLCPKRFQLKSAEKVSFARRGIHRFSAKENTSFVFF